MMPVAGQADESLRGHRALKRVHRPLGCLRFAFLPALAQGTPVGLLILLDATKATKGWLTSLTAPCATCRLRVLHTGALIAALRKWRS